MGKHANESAYREWERRQDKAFDKSQDPTEPLTDEEKRQFYEWHRERLIDEVREMMR